MTGHRRAATPRQRAKDALVTLVMALAIVLVPLTVSGQAATPASAYILPERPETLLPDASVFGADWSMIGTPVTDVVNTATWAQAATASYTNPAGDTVAVAIRYVQDDRQAILDVDEMLRHQLYGRTEYLYGNGDEPDLGPLPPCETVGRVEGDNGYVRPIGLTHCTIDTYFVMWVEVTGTVFKLTRAAADAVTTLLLTGAPPLAP